MSLTNAEAPGRTYAAARMMAGLDHGCCRRWCLGCHRLKCRAGSGRPTRTIKAIKALARQGVLVSFSSNTGLASVAISFAADEEEEE
jgi:hypothetical protein